ncbi:MAG TPA: hypothetical protein PLS49_01835 [Candidatus Woesebacteria bacterium]|nr:hypothetical protein [Candidatus Woesebacteria bacterium]
MSIEQEINPIKRHPLERSRSGEVLREVSVDIVPIMYDPQYPTLQRFLNTIIDNVVEQYKAVMSSELPIEEVVKDVIFFAGTPGSGKSYTMRTFDNALRARRIPELYINKIAWEDADSNKQKRYRARPLSSLQEMHEANQRMIQAYDSKKRWILARGEFAPIVMRSNDGQWLGRDGGATCIEYILNNTPNIRPHVVGTAAEWRLDEFTNAAREVGAYGNQVVLYQQLGRVYAEQLRKNQHIEVPEYLTDYLSFSSDSTPLEHDDFPQELFKVIESNAQLLLRTPEKQERFMSLKSKYGKNEAKKIVLTETTNQIAQADCKAISTLYTMNHMFNKELGIPAEQIFMGIMAPPLKNLEGRDNLTMSDYVSQYSVTDLFDE